MSIRLFDIQNGKVTPTEHCYTIKSLKIIMDNYKDDYLSIYAYLFYSSCLNDEENPFANVPENDKEEIILKEVGGDFSIDEEVIFQALETCKTLFSTPTYRLYLAAKIGIEKIRDHIQTSPIITGRDGNELSYLKYMERYDEVCKSFEARYKAFKEEQSTLSRGKNSLAYDQN